MPANIWSIWFLSVPVTCFQFLFWNVCLRYGFQSATYRREQHGKDRFSGHGERSRQCSTTCRAFETVRLSLQMLWMLFSWLDTTHQNTALIHSTLELHYNGGKVNTGITNFLIQYSLRFIVWVTLEPHRQTHGLLYKGVPRRAGHLWHCKVRVWAPSHQPVFCLFWT